MFVDPVSKLDPCVTSSELQFNTVGRLLTDIQPRSADTTSLVEGLNLTERCCQTFNRGRPP